MNSQVCEACGCRLLNHYQDRKHLDMRCNRKRVDPYYANRGGKPELANKLVCPLCYALLLSRVHASFDVASIDDEQGGVS